MIIVFEMLRAGKSVADVVTTSAGKCVVAWPTSTIVYDSEEDARSVHIDHMRGRGEQTTFELLFSSSKDFDRGWRDCAQDDCEGCPFASIGGLEARDDPRAPDYGKEPDGVPIGNANEYLLGYTTYARSRYGADWRTCTFSYAAALSITSLEATS